MLKNVNSDSNPLVDVIMPTYNHERYIYQAIQSVLMQECYFNYRLIIGEDCSTDNTLEICRQFADANLNRVLLLKHSSNLGMAANYKILFKTSTAKYISILEGDDYWLDKYKLQKQVDILESKPEVELVHTNYYSLYENGKKKKGHLWEKNGSLNGNVIGSTQTANININPLTTCFRAKLAKDNVDFDFLINNNLLTIDIFLLAEVCRRTSVHYIDEVSGVYRVHSDSITGNSEITSVERFCETSLLLVNYLMEKYDTPADVKEAHLSQNRLYLIYHYLLANQPIKAKLELQNIKIISTLKDKIIYLSAKYKPLNFLCKILALYYKFGSILKQSLNRVHRIIKKPKHNI